MHSTAKISYFARTEKDSSPFRFEPDLLALARDEKILFVTLSGGDSTKNRINTDVLVALGPDGTLVNVSRGSTVDEPDINPAFVALDNAVLHLHHASGTVETRKAMCQLLRDNLAVHFAGKPLLTPFT